MQPYQKAAEENIRQRTRPLEVGANLGARIMPLLNTLVPTAFAVKGLNKIDSRLGKFISHAEQLGNDFGEVREFIKGKVESSQQPAKENRNIIEMESPELHQFISQAIKGGKKPFQAAMEATKDIKHLKKIVKLEKEHKTPWQKIVQSIYGGEAVVPEQALPQDSGLSRESLIAQGQQQQPQQGAGDDQILAAINRVLKM